MQKPIKHAVSVIIRDGDRTLFALRSSHKKRFPLTWSLPSYFMKEGEVSPDTIRRIGEDKLGVSLEPVKLLNEGYGKRNGFILCMHNYEARVIEGRPHINSDDYTKLSWENPATFLPLIKVKGECTRLYEEYLHNR